MFIVYEQARSGFDEAFVEAVGEIDAAMFWSHHFNIDRTVSFPRFVEAYHSYVLRTFLFKRLDKTHLSTLLYVTMLDSSTPTTGEPTVAEVTLSMFSTWLKRFGPFKDTLCKASVLALPEASRAVAWFGKSMNRSAATKALEANLTRNEGRPIVPSNLFILRYSSDPSVQFVVTTKPMQTVEHYTINNGPLGYYISVGSTDSTSIEYSPTLLECIQTNIFDKLFTRAFGREVCISRESFQQWEDIFNAAMAELPDDHYADVGTLNRAMQSLATSAWRADEEGEVGGTGSGHIHFETMFDNKKYTCENEEECEKSDDVVTVAAITPATANEFNAEERVLPHDADLRNYPSKIVTDASTATAQRSSTTLSTPSTHEKIVIARYMIEQGVQLLGEADALSHGDMKTLTAILAKLY
jgi:hypothetical protein